MVFKKLNSRPGRIIRCQTFHRLLKQYVVITGYPFIWHLFTLERVFGETFEGVGWGFRGLQPSEPPGNPQPTPRQPPRKCDKMTNEKKERRQEVRGMW